MCFDSDSPPPIAPVSQALPDVAVWAWASLFVHVTLSPTLTVTVLGEKVNPEMATA